MPGEEPAPIFRDHAPRFLTTTTGITTILVTKKDFRVIFVKT